MLYKVNDFKGLHDYNHHFGDSILGGGVAEALVARAAPCMFAQLTSARYSKNAFGLENAGCLVKTPDVLLSDH